jgi:hypothetical protein
MDLALLNYMFLKFALVIIHFNWVILKIKMFLYFNFDLIDFLHFIDTFILPMYCSFHFGLNLSQVHLHHL